MDDIVKQALEIYALIQIPAYIVKKFVAYDTIEHESEYPEYGRTPEGARDRTLCGQLKKCLLLPTPFDLMTMYAVWKTRDRNKIYNNMSSGN